MRKLQSLLFIALLFITSNAMAQSKHSDKHLTLKQTSGNAQVNAQDQVVESTPPPPIPGKKAPVDTPAYEKYPDLPAFKILQTDSSTIFNTFNIPTGKPVVVMIFMPDCEHCQHLTAQLVKGMDSMKNIQFYMVTPGFLTHIKAFYYKFNLKRFKNVHIGKDYEFFCPGFYQARFVPFLAVYNKDKKFVKSFEGTATVHDIVEAAYGSKN